MSARRAVRACNQWRQALLEDGSAPGLADHLATCEQCRALRDRLDAIDRLAMELTVPPVPARLGDSLRRGYRLWRSQAGVGSAEVSKHLPVVIEGGRSRPPALEDEDEAAAKHQAQPTVRPHRRRNQPRTSGAERAILLAGARLLEERGVERLSIQAVAAAARVSKTTIYRRWPSKEALILDLLAGAADEPVADAGGGSAPRRPPG